MACSLFPVEVLPPMHIRKLNAGTAGGGGNGGSGSAARDTCPGPKRTISDVHKGNNELVRNSPHSVATFGLFMSSERKKGTFFVSDIQKYALRILSDFFPKKKEMLKIINIKMVAVGIEPAWKSLESVARYTVANEKFKHHLFGTHYSSNSSKLKKQIPPIHYRLDGFTI